MSQFGNNLFLVNRYMRRHREAYMEQYGLKGVHGRMFQAICQKPGASQESIAKILRLDKSTVARQAELLESNGYLTRSPLMSDKRVLCVYPTEKMQKAYEDLSAAMECWENVLLGELNPEEQQQFLALLARVRLRAEGGV